MTDTDHDELRGGGMDALGRELVIAVRTLLRRRGFTSAAILTLVLGIGVNLGVFGVIDSVVLNPLPFRDPGRIVVVQMVGPSSVSAQRLDRLLALTRSYETLGAYTGFGYALTGSGEAVHLQGARVTPNLLDILGIRPASGRFFTESEARGGSDAVAVLSDPLWRTTFGADPSLVGRSITLDGRKVEVIGIMPRGFAFPSRAAQLWTPAPLNPSSPAYGASMLTVVGRLAAGVSAEAATAELRIARGQIRAEVGVTGPFDPAETRVLSFADRLVGSRAASLFTLGAVVGIVLLIACANVANLMLVRASTRIRELAIRSALGASRPSLLRLAIAEPLLITVVGGALGFAAAPIAYRVLTTLVAGDAPLLGGVSIRPSMVAVALVLTVASAVVVGIVPAFAVWRSDAVDAMRDGGRGTGKSRLANALVTVELSLAFVLVVAAGLLSKGLWRLQQVSPGFEADHVLALRVSPSPQKYSDASALLSYWTRAFDAVGALPGVEGVGAIHLTPMGLNNWNPDLDIEGAPAPRPGESRSVDWRLVSTGYFRTMGIRAVQGRLFGESDGPTAPGVAIVNSTLARQYLGSGEVVGRRVHTVFEGANKFVTIVGVVEDVRGHGLAVDPVPELYRPLAQRVNDALTVMVRTSADPAALVTSVRRRLADVDPTAIVDEVRPMQDIVRESVAGPRRGAALIAGFAALALALAAVGVFGVMSFTVLQRTRELGIRIALGASTGAIHTLVIGRAMRLAAVGMTLGVALALAGGRLIRAQLYVVEPTDPSILIGAMSALALVAAFAAWLPARRAASIEPGTTLRLE
jgi:predicted permease